MEKDTVVGDSPVLLIMVYVLCATSGVMLLGIGVQTGGKFHLQLHMSSRPIANKYHEGKVKSTLERELTVPELAEGEANAASRWVDLLE